ncbi:hypothetical protein BC332_23928 [Capsicum chinense]|nr:hypothetical protein BC332_23928 [Capsicum chinense]
MLPKKFLASLMILRGWQFSHGRAYSVALKSNVAGSLVEDYAAYLELQSEECQIIEDCCGDSDRAAPSIPPGSNDKLRCTIYTTREQ